MDEIKEVTIVEASMVSPATPTPSQILYLSSLDLFWREYHYNRRVLFYSNSNIQQQDAFIKTLKETLAQVLVPFYPAAGRLALSNPDGRTCLDCNDEGVEFIVATVDCPLQELQAFDFQPCPFFNKLAQWEEHPLSEIYNMPLLSIQVTRFRCGGIAIGYAHSHVLADGHSMWHFMNSWAECARNEPISVPPLHMRTAFAVESPLEERAFLNYPPEDPSMKGQIGPGNSKEPLMERYFQCTGDMIAKLKQEANRMAPNGSTLNCTNNGSHNYFTSYEALCANWWKHITRARELGDEETVVRFGVLANMRSRLKSKLPPAYFGNAIIFASAFASAGDILQESLASTAARIHEASIASSEEAMWGIIHWLELHGNKFGSRMRSKAPVVKTASSPRFQVYNVDFGNGRPLAVRTVKTKGDGEMVLFPSRDGNTGGVDICLPLTIQAMERLETICDSSHP